MCVACVWACVSVCWSAYLNGVDDIVVVDVRLLIWSTGVFRSLQLDLQSFHANLEAVHGLYGRLSTRVVVERHETCAKGGAKHHPTRLLSQTADDL